MALSLPHFARVGVGVTLCLAALGAPGVSFAKLGEGAYSVDLDQSALSAVQRTQAARRSFTVHEMRTPSGWVREYVSPSGTVFAITWKGSVHPDLSTLLGTYYSEYQAESKRRKATPGQRHLHLKSARMVLEKSGHMRNVRGRAFDPKLIPAGVNLNEIL